MLSQWKRLWLVFQPSNLFSKDISIFLLLITLTWITGFYGFSRVTPFGVCGGPERTENLFCGGILRTLSPDSSCQLDVFWHDSDSPGVDSTQVGILKQTDKVRLCCLLKTQ